MAFIALLALFVSLALSVAVVYCLIRLIRRLSR